LPAKPIIDIDLTGADAADEAAYVPGLEGAGFVLLARDPAWHQHRLMVASSPTANLHVWSPDSPEAIGHRMFHHWLLDHPRTERATPRRSTQRRTPPTPLAETSWPTNAQAGGGTRDPGPDVPRPWHV
jgi:GrpB-like predicted nucleotidyltransferase (UPF0157 family)